MSQFFGACPGSNHGLPTECMETIKPVTRVKKVGMVLNFLVGLLLSVSVVAQSAGPDQKMPVSERMAKARAAKADKKESKAPRQDGLGGTATLNRPEQKATPTDYKAPVVKSEKGPNGEVVYTGERGGKYYINKNGNKTYLSSNQ